jgi:hypothetical protein
VERFVFSGKGSRIMPCIFKVCIVTKMLSREVSERAGKDGACSLASNRFHQLELEDFLSIIARMSETNPRVNNPQVITPSSLSSDLHKRNLGKHKIQEQFRQAPRRINFSNAR